MKVLFIILFSIINGICLGQIGADSPYNKEDIDQIILNYRDQGIEKFKVKYKYKFNRQKSSGFNFTTYYTFKNDSVFAVKNKHDRQYFIIHGNEIQYLPNIEKLNSAGPSDFFGTPWIASDSAKFKIQTSYICNFKGPYPVYKAVVVFDSLNRKVSELHWDYNFPEFSRKEIWEFHENNAIQYYYYKWKNSDWIVYDKYEETKKIIYSKTDSSYVEQTIATSSNKEELETRNSISKDIVNIVDSTIASFTPNGNIINIINVQTRAMNGVQESIEIQNITPKILRRKKKSL